MEEKIEKGFKNIEDLKKQLEARIKYLSNKLTLCYLKCKQAKDGCKSGSGGNLERAVKLLDGSATVCGTMWGDELKIRSLLEELNNVIMRTANAMESASRTTAERQG